jgi:plastocyanin
MRKLAVLPATALIAFALAACGGGGGSSSTAAESEAETEAVATTGAPQSAEKLERSVKVEIANFAYSPDPVRVQTGGKVIWQNMDSTAHTATADDGSFDTGTLEEGKLKSETFKKPGVYTYFCQFHPTMHGTVEVVDKE